MNNEDKENRLSFTTDFHYENGKAFFQGFALETVVSNRINARYRVLVRHPDDGHLYNMKGMEKPMTQDQIQEVIENQHSGSLCGEEFAFEVFDDKDELLFATKFNAQERIPPDGYHSDKMVSTSFSWIFDLPERLRI
jgi:hypothetical protein